MPFRFSGGIGGASPAPPKAMQGGRSMRRTSPSRASVFGAAVACAALILTGADKKKKEIPPKVDESVGDVAHIYGSEAKVEGVGLLLGLDGTGSEPAPSWQQKKLVDQIQKAGIEPTQKFLKSPNR